MAWEHLESQWRVFHAPLAIASIYLRNMYLVWIAT